MAAAEAEAVYELPRPVETALPKTKCARSKSTSKIFSPARSPNALSRSSSSKKFGLFSPRKGNTPRGDINNTSLLRNRIKYGPKTLDMKMEAFKETPGLQLFSEAEGRFGRNFLICGMNAIRAEILDLNMMILAMEHHKQVLTHEILGRFFEWLSIFALYVERYMIIEEDEIFHWIEAARGRLKGEMRISVRMEFRGRLRKAIQDVESTHTHFRTNLPAGEKFHILKDAAIRLSELAVDYTRRFVKTLTPVVEKAFSKLDVEKMRRKVIKHITRRVGAEDVLVLYTRWMSPMALSMWKWKYLVKAEFVYLSFRRWEANMYEAHFAIVADFEDTLAEDNRDKERTEKAKEWLDTFRRASIIHDHVHKTSYPINKDHNS